MTGRYRQLALAAAAGALGAGVVGGVAALRAWRRTPLVNPAPAVLEVPGARGPAAAAPAPTVDLPALRTRLAALATRLTAAEPVEIGDEILALGPCRRPSAAERAAMTRRIARTATMVDEPSLRFGCVDPGGVIVDLAFERASRGAPARQERVSQVLRLSGPTATAPVTVLAQRVGVSILDVGEYVEARSVSTRVLVDLDGDGQADPLIDDEVGEGGAAVVASTLSLWRTATRRRAAVGDVVCHGGVQVAMAHRAPGAPVVLRCADADRGRSVVTYTCLMPAGSLEACGEIAPVRHADRVAQILAGLRQPEPGHEAALDRDALDAQLFELGLDGAERAALVRLAPPTPPAVRVQRLLAQALPRADEPGAPPGWGSAAAGAAAGRGPDPAELAGIVGNRRCPAASEVTIHAAMPRLVAWLAAHTAHAMHGAGAGWRPTAAPTVIAACTVGADSAFWLSATYRRRGEPSSRVVRATLLVMASGHVRVVADRASSVIDDCPACGGASGDFSFDASLWERDGALWAAAIYRADGDPTAELVTTRVGVEVDRRPVDVASSKRWFAPGVLAGRDGYRGWTGAWTAVDQVAPAATAWLARAAAWTAADATIRWFEPTRWAADAAYRGEVERALAELELPAALRAQVAAQAAASPR
ncbi:MAG: hypothetical protein R3B06_23705 [Kofleriaceae bacterium]